MEVNRCHYTATYGMDCNIYSNNKRRFLEKRFKTNLTMPLKIENRTSNRWIHRFINEMDQLNGNGSVEAKIACNYTHYEIPELAQAPLEQEEKDDLDDDLELIEKDILDRKQNETTLNYYLNNSFVDDSSLPSPVNGLKSNLNLNKTLSGVDSFINDNINDHHSLNEINESKTQFFHNDLRQRSSTFKAINLVASKTPTRPSFISTMTSKSNESTKTTNRSTIRKESSGEALLRIIRNKVATTGPANCKRNESGNLRFVSKSFKKRNDSNLSNASLQYFLEKTGLKR
jgi:hypothetical protein